MQCEKCGAAYDPTDNYCRNCGERLRPPEIAAGPQPSAELVKKRGRTIKRFRIACVAIVMFALLIEIFVQIAPSLLSTVKLPPKDLGVKWTDADYQSVLAKTDIQADDPPAGEDRSVYSDVYTGQKNIDWTLTESEITAWLNKDPQPGYWPFSEMQFKIHSGNVFEASFRMSPTKLMTWPVVTNYLPQEVKNFINRIPLQLPIYVKGQITFTGPKQVEIHLQQFSASGISIPDLAVSDEANQILESIVNDMLGEIEPISITSFTTEDGSLKMSGTWYEDLKRVKNK